MVEKHVPTILMNCDNQMVIAKMNNSKDNVKSSRHVKRRLKSVGKLRNSGVITVTYIQTDKNLSDPFTKGLSRNVIDIASRGMGFPKTPELRFALQVLDLGYEKSFKEYV